MKIDPKLCLTKQQKIVACSCKVTGINSALIVPAIAGQVFEYVHPLSYYSNCSGMIKQGAKYLAELDQQILAGLFISSYQHYELLDLLELSAQEANAILCTASKASLVEALELVPYFTHQNVVASPIFSMYWKGLEAQPDINEALTGYIRRLAKDFKTPQTLEERKQGMITVLNKEAIERRLHGGYTAISSSMLSDSEKDFEDSFKEWKKEAKRLISALANNSTLSSEFIAFLKTVNKDRNMITMSQSLREKVAQKLQDKQHPDAIKLAKIILDCSNPYDMDISDAPLADVPMEQPKRITSLREILAAKRRQSTMVATDAQEVVNLYAAQNTIEEYDAAIDAEEEDEIEAVDDKLNALNNSRSFGEDF